ncbi:HNH endonuclease [Bacillus sp. ISL-4]|uniref:HNH endonuclease signature motif containing protein n=1 Tax=Bacillus sp. ISL-4 TaxID=2819125 RepID=UPI001BE65CE8|nr:HNH endonuclease signature motif containing protein [Bacillus sp. ISL-4]MBT2667293.1 HNH endonuclease [Bacillus sp. ISL-4]MBT2670599.1 HNH endonuclease [Streptomyces sp. ISL-14]
MKKVKRKDFKNFEVAFYWGETPYFRDNGMSVLESLDIHIEYPQCFACGKSKFIDSKTSMSHISMWNASKLEKHHFDPLSLGGEDEIHNIVLLCKKCHSEAPMSRLTLEEIIIWCKSKPSHIEEEWANSVAGFYRMLENKFENEQERNAFMEWFVKNISPIEPKEMCKTLTSEQLVSSHFGMNPTGETIAYACAKLYEKENVQG